MYVISSFEFFKGISKAFYHKYQPLDISYITYTHTYTYIHVCTPYWTTFLYFLTVSILNLRVSNSGLYEHIDNWIMENSLFVFQKFILRRK